MISPMICKVFILLSGGNARFLTSTVRRNAKGVGAFKVFGALLFKKSEWQKFREHYPPGN